MMIVVPELSNNLELFGIYSVCLSISIYLSYADLGFISAGQKFAAEAYKTDKTSNELALTGFSIFILILMFIPFSVLAIFLATDPDLLLKNLSSINRVTASQLLLIVGILLPIQIILDRTVNFILAIRIKDFIGIRVSIVINAIKIISVYYFFHKDAYMLREYYLFITTISIFGSLVTLYIIKTKLNYNLFVLLKNIKFQKAVFDKVGRLALSSFLLTISFVIYFQIDSIIIAKLIGAKEVAIFAVGFTLLTYLKTIANIGYSPFSIILNHQAAKNEDYHFTIQKILVFTFPIYLIAIIVLSISAQYLVIFWVGSEYQNSIIITQLLFVSMLCQWINTPASYFYNTALKYTYINFLAGSVPIIFVLFILLTYKNLGINAFAWAKIFVGGFISIVAFNALRSNINLKEIFIQPILPLVITLIPITLFLPDYLKSIFTVVDKNGQNLLLLLIIDSAVILMSLFTIVFLIPDKRKYILDFLLRNPN